MNTSNTKLVRMILDNKGLSVIQFKTKKNNMRVIACTVNASEPMTPLGYLVVREKLSEEYKTIDPKNIMSAIINGITYTKNG